MISLEATQQVRVKQPKSLEELLGIPPEDLGGIDVALMNLLCATGLPGAEELATGRCLATLEQWARNVRHETSRHLYRLHDPRYAAHYNHSEARLRVEFVLSTLCDGFGVRYNLDRKDDVDFRDSRDLFIHGLLDGAHHGTCSSMPVLFVAVGRRLRYPMWIVSTCGHLFARWDAPGGERFNIECNGWGVDYFDDEHYKEWPFPLSDKAVRRGRYLQSFSPAEELAAFLAARGHCLLDNDRPQEALTAYDHAHRLCPERPSYTWWRQSAAIRARPMNTTVEISWISAAPELAVRMPSNRLIDTGGGEGGIPASQVFELSGGGRHSVRTRRRVERPGRPERPRHLRLGRRLPLALPSPHPRPLAPTGPGRLYRRHEPPGAHPQQSHHAHGSVRPEC